MILTVESGLVSVLLTKKIINESKANFRNVIIIIQFYFVRFRQKERHCPHVIKPRVGFIEEVLYLH